jgi:Flp pilus assembly protein TadD/TolB-like protein
MALFFCFQASGTSAWAPVKAIVFPLEDASQVEPLSWLSEGVALSISEQIAGHGVEPMSRSKRIELIESLDLPPGAPLSRASMIRVAQQASVDWIVIGTFAGIEAGLRITVRVLDVKSLKLGGEMVANGPLSALPQLENELSWLILKNSGLEEPFSREKFAEQTRKVPNGSYSLFIQSLGQQSEKEQLRTLLKAVEAFRNYPQAQFEIGRHYFRSGECNRALMHLNLGNGGGNTAAESDFMRGTCYLQANQPAQAIEALSRIAASSRSVEVLNNLGVAYLRAGDFAQALGRLTEAQNLSRVDSVVALNLAIVRHLQGNDTAAFGGLEEAMKSYPNNGMLQFLLSFLLKERGESEKADAAAGRARGLGINVDKLQAEDPKTWSRVLFTWK